MRPFEVMEPPHPIPGETRRRGMRGDESRVLFFASEGGLTRLIGVPLLLDGMTLSQLEQQLDPPPLLSSLARRADQPQRRDRCIRYREEQAK